jgi:hypothetical protein
LAYDVENAPSTYGGGDYTFPKLTAIGWQFLDKKKPESVILNRRDPDSMREDAEAFRSVWDAADFVLGHNIRRHDQKLLDGFYTSLDLPLLSRKRMVDTYCDQPKMQGFSRSLENLAARWGCPEKKMSLSEYDWQRAYDGLPEGLELMRKRVESDVRISIWLYRTLLERELL